MFIVGLNDKKLLVYSQASATKYLLPPTLVLPPMLLRIPPTEIVGSILAGASRISETIEVVVVFP